MEHSKVSGHSVNTKKLIACLYTNNKQFEFEIKKKIPFTTASKKERKNGRKEANWQQSRCPYIG